MTARTPRSDGSTWRPPCTKGGRSFLIRDPEGITDKSLFVFPGCPFSYFSHGWDEIDGGGIRSSEYTKAAGLTIDQDRLALVVRTLSGSFFFFLLDAAV